MALDRVGELDVDIEGDHLIPIIWERRLHLIWPIFYLRAMPKAVTDACHRQFRECAAARTLPCDWHGPSIGTASGSRSG